MAGTLSLKDCAERLGVHYMTAYRYIRLGRLPATKVGAEWRVLPSDLEALLADVAAPTVRGSADWSARLEDRLLAGDEGGSWSVVEAALASGVSPSDVHVDLLGPALTRIGAGWHDGQVSIAEEHRATAVATKIAGRLGPRFSPRGRRRGKVIVGAPTGERHALAVAIVADLIRAAGWEVVELGVDLPVDEFVTCVEKEAPVFAIAISMATAGGVTAGRELIDSLRQSVNVPVVVGGSAVDSTAADSLGADAWASDGRAAVEALAALVARS
jgi:MerR family transcriptional regulator, light-induced transcriptional regulator